MPERATSGFKEGPNDYYSADDIAGFLGVHRVTVYRMGKAGKIPQVRVSKSIVRFPAREVNEWLRNMREEVA